MTDKESKPTPEDYQKQLGDLFKNANFSFAFGPGGLGSESEPSKEPVSGTGEEEDVNEAFAGFALFA